MTDSVIFDMDGVLFDSERIYNDAWYRVGEKMNLSDIDACVKKCVGRNGKDTLFILLETYGKHFPAEQYMKDVRSAFEEIVAVEGLPLKVGTVEVLSWLERHDYKVGLATSTSRRSAERHLQDAGLFSYFQAVITGDMIQNGKPHPEIYRRACAALGVLPETCFAIEDSPNGIKSAHGAGLKVIMVPDLIEPTAEIEKLLYAKFHTLLEVKAYFEHR